MIDTCLCLNLPTDIPEWASGEEDHVVARAEYDFDSDRMDEISFRAGDLLNLAPKGIVSDFNEKVL